MPYASQLDYNANKRKKYKERREALINLMGGQCCECHEKDHSLLEFDHYKGDRDWLNKDVGCVKRLEIYKQEYFAGRLRLACISCNRKKNQYYYNNAGKYKNAPGSSLEL